MTPQPSTAPDPIDSVVGQMIKVRRNLSGLSQEALGEALGLSRQQIEKYESGKNRVAASTLVALGEALDCPATAFLPAPPGAEATPDSPWPAPTPEARDLLASYQQIPVDLRRALIIILKVLAKPA